MASPFNSNVWPGMVYPPSAIPPQKIIWTPAPPPINKQVYFSVVLTQQQINALFKIQDLRLLGQAPTPT